MSAGPIDSAGTNVPRWRAGAASLIVAALVAVAILAVFTPRFVYWRGLALPGTRVAPEFGRAAMSFAQIQNPWEPIS
jgi:hypothetical protein